MPLLLLAVATSASWRRRWRRVLTALVVVAREFEYALKFAAASVARTR
jgi:hypothetical protein